jgi:hypothetical protein
MDRQERLKEVAFDQEASARVEGPFDRANEPEVVVPKK